MPKLRFNLARRKSGGCSEFVSSIPDHRFFYEPMALDHKSVEPRLSLIPSFQDLCKLDSGVHEHVMLVNDS